MQIDAMGSSTASAAAFQTAQSARADAQSRQFADALQTAQAGAAKTAAKDKKLQSACEGFEEMFLNLMYSKMRDTVPENKLFGSSNGEKIMQSMLDSEMTKQMAKAGGVGLADMLYTQLIKEKK